MDNSEKSKNTCGMWDARFLGEGRAVTLEPYPTTPPRPNSIPYSPATRPQSSQIQDMSSPRQQI
jgi:hypothetical protein